MQTTLTFSHSTYTANIPESTEYSTVHKSTTTSIPNSEDSNWWHLINLIGLAVFLIVVIGPVAYITFCCRRPYRGQTTKCCVLCDRLFTCFWCRKRLGYVDDEEATHDNISTSTIYDCVLYDPPTYDEALGMPRLEDTIPGTPPPMYSDYFKVKIEGIAQEGGNSHINPVFEFDVDDIGTFQSRSHSFHNSFGSRSTWTHYDEDYWPSRTWACSEVDECSLVNDIIRTAPTTHVGNNSRHSRRKNSLEDGQSNTDTHNSEDPTSSERILTLVTVMCRAAGLGRSPSMISKKSTNPSTENLPTYQEALVLINKRKASQENSAELSSAS